MIKIVGFYLCFLSTCMVSNPDSQKLKVGAEQYDEYSNLLEGKKIGLVVNHTAMVGEKHLVDFLLERNQKIKAIFAPEHGFRGDASAGEIIKDGVDSKTGIPVISLYGKTKKPTQDHLQNIDVLIFDVQDVGCRFYTYISTLKLVLEACAEHNVRLVVLDRPNPNGDYVAGPVLENEFESFVGLMPVPVVHGCTVGELAKMINGENWHNANKKCDLKVVKVKNYTHSTVYQLPVIPSPNLPNYRAVRLYPSLCFFEATSVSVGRGTDFPFQVLGGLQPDLGEFEFIPRSIPGVAVNPLNNNKKCYGVDLRLLDTLPKFTLNYFIEFYNKFENKADFLTREPWFNLLAGTDEVLEKIKEGTTESELVNAWMPELKFYKALRKKYLLYPDFE